MVDRFYSFMANIEGAVLTPSIAHRHAPLNLHPPSISSAEERPVTRWDAMDLASVAMEMT